MSAERFSVRTVRLETPNYGNTPQIQPAIDRRRPGPGYRHVLKKDDVARFIRILPNWPALAVRLNAIVLAPGDDGCYGWHRSGIVAVCAWGIELWQEWPLGFFEEHQRLFDRIGVPCEITDVACLCKFEPATVRAFQLIHILLHELGHHHDRMTTRSQRRASRGERFAEQYAQKFEAVVWNRYANEFGLP